MHFRLARRNAKLTNMHLMMLAASCYCQGWDFEEKKSPLFSDFLSQEKLTLRSQAICKTQTTSNLQYSCGCPTDHATFVFQQPVAKATDAPPSQANWAGLGADRLLVPTCSLKTVKLFISPPPASGDRPINTGICPTHHLS